MAQDYVDDSNPFSRSGDEVELRREYGSKGRDIEVREPAYGEKEGLSVEKFVGEPGSGAPRNE